VEEAGGRGAPGVKGDLCFVEAVEGDVYSAASAGGVVDSGGSGGRGGRGGGGGGGGGGGLDLLSTYSNYI
jgi:hypothetical protein